jgi:WD40 repeat protein
VLTPDELWLYSADFRLLSERTLALSNRAHEGYWHFSYSPNGKYLLVMRGVNPSEVSGGQAHGSTLYYGYEWISLDDLRLLRSWQENSAENLWKGKEDFNVTGGSLGSIFNDQIIRPFYKGFLVRELDGPLRFVRFSRAVASLGAFEFLTSQLIISERQSNLRAHWKGNITLIRINGEVLFQQEFSDRELLDWLRSSADGGRFALAIYRGRGGSVALDIPARYTLDRIMVYDVNVRHWVYTIGAKSQGIKDLTGLALSPDGSSLAIIGDDSKLRLYGLPKSHPAASDR